MKCFYTDEDCHMAARIKVEEGPIELIKLGIHIAKHHCAPCRIEALRQTIEEESNDWYKALYPGD